MNELVIFAPIGLLGGVLIGMTGMGGGSLTTPLLILAGGINPLAAVGTDLVYSAFTKLAGGWQHVRLRNVHLRTVALLAAGSAPGGLLALLLLRHLLANDRDLVDAVLTRVLSLALLLTAAVVLYRTFVHKSKSDSSTLQRKVSPRCAIGCTVLSGFLTGVFVGLSSVGSGVLVCSFLLLTTQFEGRRVVGTDVFHGFILTAGLSLGHLSFGEIRWDVALALLSGSIPGVLLGSRLVGRVSEPALRTGLAALLTGIGLTLLRV